MGAERREAVCVAETLQNEALGGVWCFSGAEEPNSVGGASIKADVQKLVNARTVGAGLNATARAIL